MVSTQSTDIEIASNNAQAQSPTSSTLLSLSSTSASLNTTSNADLKSLIKSSNQISKPELMDMDDQDIKEVECDLAQKEAIINGNGNGDNSSENCENENSQSSNNNNNNNHSVNTLSDHKEQILNNKLNIMTDDLVKPLVNGGTKLTNGISLTNGTSIKHEIIPITNNIDIKIEELAVKETKPDVDVVENDNEMLIDDINNNNSVANLNSNANSDDDETENNANLVIANGKRTLKLNDEKYRLLKQQKSLKLKQLKFDLCKEEAKLILLKRLYYSQRMPASGANGQVVAQQQQLQQRGVGANPQNITNANSLKNPLGQSKQQAQQRGSTNQFMQNNNSMQHRSIINQRVSVFVN